MKESQRGALTSCWENSKGLIRTAKESQPARGTYLLLITVQGTGQENEIKSARKMHSHTVKHRVRDLFGQQKKASKQWALTA
jgi:hypothetical protein